MTAQELLIHLTERQIDSLFRAARSLPADRLEWKPAPGARTALDQLQEVATAVDRFWQAQKEYKMEWSPEQFQEWREERAKIRTLEDLEQHTRESIGRLIEFIRETKAEDLTLPVQLPFPGEFNLAFVLSYHYWNMSYHEGQINYIASLVQ